MAAVVPEYFIEAPEQSYKETEEFIEKVENFYRDRTSSIESNLEHSISSNGRPRIDNFKFWTTSEKDVEDLIAKSLMVEYNTNWADLKAELRQKTHDYYDKDLEKLEDASSRKVEILKNIYDLLESNIESIKKWVKKSRDGLYCPQSSSTFGEENGIVLEIIPRSFEKKIETRQHVLNPVFEKSVRTDNRFNAVLIHELNHAYLDLEGENYERKGFLGPHSGPKSDNFLEAFNEIFAYYTSYLVGRNPFQDDESDLYGRPDIIKWGLEILIEKSSEFNSRGKKNTGIDFCREIMLKLDDHENSVGVFLNFCLLKEDKRRLNRIQGILKQLEKSYSKFWKFMVSLEKENLKARNISGKRKLIDDLTSKRAHSSNFNKVKEGKILFHSTFREAIIKEIINETVKGDKAGYGDLEQINSIITERLKLFARSLEEIEKELDTARTRFDNPEIIENVVDMEEKLSASKKKIIKSTEEDRLDA